MLSSNFHCTQTRAFLELRASAATAMRGARVALLLCLAGAVTMAAGPALADTAVDDVQQQMTDLETNLRKLLPQGSRLDGVAETPMQGVYEVSVGGKSIYVHSSGDHVLIGEAYDVNRRVSLLDEKRAEKMSEVMATVDPEDMIVMKTVI